MQITKKLTQENISKRILWVFGIYWVLTLTAFAIGYFLLPEGVFRGSPVVVLGNLVAQHQEFWPVFLRIVFFNLGLVLLVGAALNIQRVRGFPTGYVFIFVQGFMSGIIAGTNSFVSQVISPYTLDGWLVALRIGHLEFLGYTCIIASTINIGLQNYDSWLPWKAKAQRIKTWKEIRFTRQEVMGMIIGVIILLIAGYNETILFGGL